MKVKAFYRHALLTLMGTVLSIGIVSCISGAPSTSVPTALSVEPQPVRLQTTPVAVSAAPSTDNGELTIFAAAGIKPAIDEATKLFEKKYGTKVSVNYGSGGQVLSNMILAKEGDAYIAPEQRFMESAKKQGAIDTEPTTIAYMIPVIGVQKGNPSKFESLSDMARPGTRVVMGRQETTALGLIGPEILDRAGLLSAVKPNIVTDAPQVTAIVTMLEMNQVDTGFIWHFYQTAAADDLDIIWIPNEYITGIGEIQAAVSTYSKKKELASQFVDFLLSSAGKETFRKNGYMVEREEADKQRTK